MHDIEAIERPDDVCTFYQGFIENMGFANVACVRLPDPGERLRDCLHMNTRPAEWSDGYEERDYFKCDPMAAELSRSYLPFAWSDVTGKRELRPEEQAVMRWASEFGMNRGFVIPIFESGGNVSIISIAGKDVELDSDRRGALTLASTYFHNCLVTMKRKLRERQVTLTPREFECLKWAAAGKSDWQTGRILSISPKTVNYHIENVKRKFGVATRVQAVVAAMRQGKLIQ